jgi:hypothetical protein
MMLLKFCQAVGVMTIAGAIGLWSSAGYAQTDAATNARLDTLFGGHAPYQAFFGRLKAVVAANDKSAVAAMIDYPVRARVNGKNAQIKNTGEFTRNYDQIINAKVKTTLEKQTYQNLFANADGVSIGDGVIWFSGIGADGAVKITAINN